MNHESLKMPKSAQINGEGGGKHWIGVRRNKGIFYGHHQRLADAPHRCHVQPSLSLSNDAGILFSAFACSFQFFSRFYRIL